MADKFYSYDPEYGFSCFNTAEQAELFAKLSLDHAIENGKWRDNVEFISWGLVIPLGKCARSNSHHVDATNPLLSDYTIEPLHGGGPPWLSDAAKALGQVAPDGTALALTWTEVLRQVSEAKRDLATLRAENARLRERVGEAGMIVRCMRVALSNDESLTMGLAALEELFQPPESPNG